MRPQNLLKVVCHVNVLTALEWHSDQSETIFSQVYVSCTLQWWFALKFLSMKGREDLFSPWDAFKSSLSFFVGRFFAAWSIAAKLGYGRHEQRWIAAWARIITSFWPTLSRVCLTLDVLLFLLNQFYLLQVTVTVTNNASWGHCCLWNFLIPPLPYPLASSL